MRKYVVHHVAKLLWKPLATIYANKTDQQLVSTIRQAEVKNDLIWL